MTLKFLANVSLPSHEAGLGFGRPAVHSASGRLYVPRLGDSGLEVVDVVRLKHSHSLPDLKGVTCIHASPYQNRLFAASAAAHLVTVLMAANDKVSAQLDLGSLAPHALAYDPVRQHLLVASDEESGTVLVLDILLRETIGRLRMPGPVHQALYHHHSGMFYIALRHPPRIVAIATGKPTHVAQTFDVPASELLGIDLGPRARRLFCIAEKPHLLAIDRRSGNLLSKLTLSGRPSGVQYNRRRQHLYVTIAERGTIETIDSTLMEPIESVDVGPTVCGVTFDPTDDRIYAVVPDREQVAAYQDLS